jgi:hypothetical protein
MVQATTSVLYVNAASGRDDKPGTLQTPLRTLTAALRQARTGTVIQVAAGTYQTSLGEIFPLKIPIGVTVIGQSGQTLLQGGGALASREFGQQSVTVWLLDRAQLQGVTVTNPQDQGTGVWIDQGAPLLLRSRIQRCKQDGVMVLDKAMPRIVENEFFENGASGLFLVRQARGEVRQNTFRKTGYGIAISDQAAPLLVANRVVESRSGIVISRSARPVLRQNHLESNQSIGLWVQDTAQPDLGHSQDLGQNVLTQNQEWDLRNDTTQPIRTAGNQINPNRVRGPITYLPSELPDPAAIPAVLLGQVTPQPSPPTPPTPPTPPAPPAPTPVGSHFTDLAEHWAIPFIDPLAEANFVKGFLDGSFRPDLVVTRAQFAALVMATFPEGESDTRRVHPFTDVPLNFWAREVIYQAQARRFLSGFPDNTFRPDAPMTRVQAIVALASGLRFPPSQSNQLSVYRDRAQIPSYAIEKVAAATQRQLVVNYPDVSQLRPMEPITRAETAALVYQALVDQGQMSRITSAFIIRPSAVTPNFTDLGQHWARPFIDSLSRQNLISGFQDGSFQPDAPMTRAQFAALVVGAYNPEPKRSASSFRDVLNNFWAAQAIQRAYQSEFLSGFPDYTFAPNHPVLKLQVLLALVSGLGLTPQAPPELSVLEAYRDRNQIPLYAQGAIATATQLQLVFNYPHLDEINPLRIATRAEVAAMVYQGMVVLEQVPPIESAYLVK